MAVKFTGSPRRAYFYLGVTVTPPPAPGIPPPSLSPAIVLGFFLLPSDAFLHFYTPGDSKHCHTDDRFTVPEEYRFCLPDFNVSTKQCPFFLSPFLKENFQLYFKVDKLVQ